MEGKYIPCISVWKKTKTNRCILSVAEKRSRISSGFWFMSHVKKTVHLQQLKEMYSSKQGMWKVYKLPIEELRKGYLFSQKWYVIGKGVGPRDRTSRIDSLLSTPQPFPLPPQTSWEIKTNQNLRNVLNNNITWPFYLLFCKKPSPKSHKWDCQNNL